MWRVATNQVPLLGPIWMCHKQRCYHRVRPLNPRGDVERQASIVLHRRERQAHIVLRDVSCNGERMYVLHSCRRWCDQRQHCFVLLRHRYGLLRIVRILLAARDPIFPLQESGDE